MMDLLESCCSSRELWEEIVSSVQHVLIITDIEGHILFAGPVSEKVLGYGPDELTSLKFSALFTPEDRKCLYPNLLFLAGKGQPFEGEVILVRRNGTSFFAHLAIRLGFDPMERKSILIIYIQDIQRQKQMEKASPTGYYEDLVKIASGIAHEIRNPLVGIGGFVNRLFKICGETHDHQEYHSHIMRNLEKIDNLVRKVELFSRLPKPTLSEEHIKPLIEGVLQSFAQTAEQRRIEVTIDVGDLILLMDKDLITRVFSILLDNAMQVVSEGGEIKVRSEITGNECTISVSDTGTGISSDDLPYIFNPFFSTKPDGAGIDLAIVKRIMESHGGCVGVRSSEGEGTTFFLKFPLERRRSIRVSLLEDPEVGKA